MKTVFTLLIVLIIAVANAQSQNKAGILDKSFGENGKVVTSFNNASVTVYKGLIQPDNKIIAVGQYESTLPPYNGFFAARYMPDGSIDSSFADSGTTILSNQYEVLIPSSACLQNDGKILIAGYGQDGLFPPVDTGIIVRLNVDGSLDSSFGKNGFVYTPNAGYDNIAIQPDGKIICIGSNFVSRLLENGSTDISFGTNGYVYFSTADVFYTCKIQQDGKILVGGYYSCCGGSPVPFLLKRLEVNGSPDSSFGSAGTTITQVGSYDSYITNLAFQSDGKIVALGLDDNGYSTATARYSIDGNLDSTFANDGIAQNFFPESRGTAASLLVQDDNKIVLGGGIDINNGVYALERLTANGLIDSSFGVSGETTTDFADYPSSINSIGLQTSGKIVAIGASYDANYVNSFVSLARYDNNLTQKQQIITKIKRWIQHHNGIEWNYNSNVSSYIVQRSYDGIHFSSIARINTGSTSNYTYEDASPLNGINYYRLQTTSVNGAVANSNVIAVTNDDIKISPNPATNILRVQGLPSNQNIKITIVDLAGNTAISQQLKANSNSYYNLNIASLKQGNYLLKIDTNDEVVTKKFVKE